MTTIATLSAVIRLEEKPFRDGKKRVKREVTDLQRVFNQLGFSADKIGASLARPFISLRILASMAKSGVNQLAASLERLATAKVDDVALLDETRFERFMSMAGDVARFLAAPSRKQGVVDDIDALTEAWNEFSGLTATRAVITMNQMDKGMAQVEARARKLTELQARLNDAMTGGDDATRAHTLKYAGENRELVELEQRLADMTKLRGQVDALLTAGKTASEKMAESQEVLNRALQEGLLTLEQYEQALKRLRTAGGSAMVINPLIARRAAPAAAPQASGATSNQGSAEVALLRQILGTLQFQGNGAAARLN